MAVSCDGEDRCGRGYSFLLLGLTDSMLGVAWPTIRQAFGEPLSALSLLLVASALGYVATTVPNGYLLNRFGAVSILTVASLTAGFACALVATRYDMKLWMRDLKEGAAYLPK